MVFKKKRGKKKIVELLTLFKHSVVSRYASTGSSSEGFKDPTMTFTIKRPVGLVDSSIEIQIILFLVLSLMVSLHHRSSHLNNIFADLTH